MPKPRIIIADADVNYIIPLQQKFMEEYFEKIDLEVISDPGYYIQLFSSPQRADVLIVSEQLYLPDLLRHSIGNIFLMSEQNMDGQNSSSNICRIYKYTNIREIFNTIIGKSFAFFKDLNLVKKETQIILVCSASGGVGKTTVSIGISACLNRNYKRVLYINASRLQTFQTMLTKEDPINDPDIYVKLVSTNENEYAGIRHTIRNEGFNYIPPFKASLMSLGIEYAVFGQIALSAKEAGDYDYIIIDADTAFDEEEARLIDIADKVMVVIRQNKASAFAADAFVSNINGADTDKYIFVCNDFDEGSTNALILPGTVNKFKVSDYIGHISCLEQYKAGDLAEEKDIQKAALLIL